MMFWKKEWWIIDKKYLIDANVFITAHRVIYPFDIAPSFWSQLIEKASPKIVIIEEVNKEILKGGDQLADWYIENKDKFNILGIPEQEVIEAYGKIINNINENEQYKQSAKDEFASIADSWLCAYGLAYDYTIVTFEKYNPDSKKKIFIPNVCNEFNIKCIDLIQFMRKVGFRL